MRIFHGNNKGEFAIVILIYREISLKISAELWLSRMFA